MVFGNNPGNIASDMYSVSAPRAVADKLPTVAGAGATNALPAADAAVPAPSEPTQEQMESALLAGIHVTADDLRVLMQARARSVQATLVGNKVEGERLFILAPAPVSLTAQGQARANLALQ